MSVLDNLKMIHQRDKEDALGVAEKQWQQLVHLYNVPLKKTKDIHNIVLAGMGGSAWYALYVQHWPGVKVPFEIVRNYELPSYVNENTLLISSSYSGNTEEALSALEDGAKKGAQIVVIAAGGKLTDIAQDRKYPLFKIPSGIQPRMSSFYMIAALIDIYESFSVLKDFDRSELSKISEWLKSEVDAWKADVATSKNPAKQLALELVGKSVIIYAGPTLSPVANKFKICLNENAKNLAWWGQYPEFNHNEFIGWSSHPVDKPFAIVDIRSDLDHPRVQKRFEVSERLLSGKAPHPNVIKPKGSTVPEQIFWTSMFCDFVANYLAVLNGVDPTPVALVEKLKKELDKN